MPGKILIQIARKLNTSETRSNYEIVTYMITFCKTGPKLIKFDVN